MCFREFSGNQIMPIMLQDIWNIENPQNYKVHFARWSGEHYPLDVWLRDRAEWQGWQEYYPGRNHFNRSFIFALMQFHHEVDCWLFGGVYKVLALHHDAADPSRCYYQVELTNQGKDFIGRLKVVYPYRDRSTRVRMENHYENFEVRQILRELFTGQLFPGYENIDLSFGELEAIVRNERADWKSALENAKGIYLLTDTNTKRRYVGSAYGEQGIWSRWSSYIDTGHGGNVELRELIQDAGLAYCRAHFRFALLEYRWSMTPDDTILVREAHWKRILLTRELGGLNRN